MSPIKNIKEVTEPLKSISLMELDEVACSVGLKNVHTIDEMKAGQQSFGYSDAI